MNLVETIKAQQRSWLKDRGVTFDERGYTSRISDNLLTLSEAGRSELSAGLGNEFGRPHRPGKIAAPWSSSALAINFFESWRALDIRPLAAALEVSGPFNGLRFEVQFATGFGAMPAHLDVVLNGAPAGSVVIESKFLEPFKGGRRGTLRKKISRTYLKRQPDPRWHGLHELRGLATAIADGRETFYRLDAPQLIKHVVALRRTGQPFELLHLWYCPPGFVQQTQQMEAELDTFRRAAAPDGLRFRSLTYQELFARLRAAAAEHATYLDYLSARYFSSSIGALGT
jgi:hypothetical protein